MTDADVCPERLLDRGPIEPTSELPPLMVLGLTLRSGVGYAVQGVSFSVRAGEMALLVGPAGGGHEACTEMVAGRTRPTFGTVTICGLQVAPGMRALSVTNRPGHAVGRTGLTGREWLEGQARWEIQTPEEAHHRVHTMVERMKLTRTADRPIRNLDRSGIRLLSVAAALLAQAPVVVLAEPITDLDTEREDTVLAAATAASEKGSAVLISASCGRIPRAQFDRVFVLRGGRLRYAGTGCNVSAWASSLLDDGADGNDPHGAIR